MDKGRLHRGSPFFVGVLVVTHSLSANDATMAGPVIDTPRLIVHVVRELAFHGCTPLSVAFALRHYVMTTGPPVKAVA